MKVIIIGAGLGGLSSACMLSHAGHDVTVVERNKQPGGKMNQHIAAGFRFDTGPSLLTMPQIIEELFSRCGASHFDYVKIKSVDPLCRYFYPDGTVFNCYQDENKTIEEIRNFAPEDIANYGRFLDHSQTLFEKTKDAFLENPLYDFEDLNTLDFTNIFHIDAFRTVAHRVDSHFESPYLQQFFKRFATYNGSSPFQAPATLNVIPHIELSQGGYYLDGGIYQLVKALEHLAKENGTKFLYNRDVNAITVKNGSVTGVKTDATELKAEVVLSNCDATETYQNLIPDSELPWYKQKKLARIEPSSSGFVLLLGTKKRFEQLGHHNIFFSKNYELEFDAIFNRKVMPDDPTIYVANTSIHNPDHAIPGGANLFILVNAPYLTKHWNWNKKQQMYGDFVISELEARGLSNLRDSIRYRHQITPAEFYRRYRSNKGSIYGTSSNGKMAAFFRPKNKARYVEGLYLTGGSTHPGGGIPLVVLSAFNAVELIERYEYN